MAEIVINNTANPKTLRYGKGKDGAIVRLMPGKPEELSDEQIAKIEASKAGKAHLDECARKRIPSAAEERRQAERDAADKRAAVASTEADARAKAKADREAAKGKEGGGTADS